MSYKHYSKDAVEQIMQNVMETKKTPDIVQSETKQLTINEIIEVGEAAGYNADSIKQAVNEYDHPSTDLNNNFENTHILLEREFETKLEEDEIWDKILHKLGHHFMDEASGKVKEHSKKKLWTYISHANHETVVSLSKKGRIAKLKVSQRLGFWSPPVEGILHGAYLSLILFGFIFVIIRSSLLLSLGIIALLWILAAMTVKRVSEGSRKKKSVQLNQFVDNIILDLRENENKVSK